MDSDDIEYEDEYVDAQAELPPVLDPQVEKEIQLVLAGSTIVKSYEGTSQYSQRGPSACGLASFNAVRTVLEKERHGTNAADLVREMMSRRFIEDATAICAAWTSSAHLEVDDISQFPLCNGALRLVNTDFRQANYAEFGKLLRRIELAAGNTRRGSAAAIITKPPEILAVFAIATGHTEPIGSPFTYAVFDSHSRPELHPNGAAFSFLGKARSPSNTSPIIDSSTRRFLMTSTTADPVTIEIPRTRLCRSFFFGASSYTEVNVQCD